MASAATSSITCRESLTRDRVSLDVYRGGHMFYTNAEERAAFTADAKAFYGQHQPAQVAD